MLVRSEKVGDVEARNSIFGVCKRAEWTELCVDGELNSLHGPDKHCTDVERLRKRAGHEQDKVAWYHATHVIIITRQTQEWIHYGKVQ